MSGESLGKRPRYFTLRDLEVLTAFTDTAPALRGGAEFDDSESGSDTTRVRIEIGVGDEAAYTSARGDGPVHAMDIGLRSLIDRFYPQLQAVRLVDYKVRVLTSNDGTGSVVRVLIQSSDGEEVWGTVGVSPNIIHASWYAMVDALEYKLLKDGVVPFATAGEQTTRSSRPAARAH